MWSLSIQFCSLKCLCVNATLFWIVVPLYEFENQVVETLQSSVLFCFFLSHPPKCLAMLVVFNFHVKFRISLWVSIKKGCCYFNWDFIEFMDSFEENWHLTALSFLIHMCISFLGLPKQSIKNWIAWNNRSLFLKILLARSIEIKTSISRAVLSEGFREETFLYSFSSGWLPAILGFIWFEEAPLQSLLLFSHGLSSVFLVYVQISCFL